TTNRPWLERLKHHLATEHDAENVCKTNAARTDRTDNTPVENSIVGSVGDSGDEITWRMAAFQARIPSHGPVWPPRICQRLECDVPGHCTLCGDELPQNPAPRFPRCEG